MRVRPAFLATTVQLKGAHLLQALADNANAYLAACPRAQPRACVEGREGVRD